ncbi:unnamed protein product, partial [Ilex paraguariensis]
LQLEVCAMVGRRLSINHIEEMEFVCIEAKSSRFGNFFRISMLMNNGKRGLIIPGEFDGEGWHGFRSLLGVFLSGRNKVWCKEVTSRGNTVDDKNSDSVSMMLKCDKVFLREEEQWKNTVTDKAIFFCQNGKEVENVCRFGNCVLDGPTRVKIQRYYQELDKFCSRASFLGGWIAMEGLPFHLWHVEVFSRLGIRVVAS